jgi:hypothetical protein
MRMKSCLSVAGLLLGVMLVPAVESAAQGRTVSVTAANGKTASATTTVDRDASDGTVGADRTVSGFNGRTKSASRQTTASDGTVQRQVSRTGAGGRTASKQGVYTEGSASHTRTTRNGNTHTRSRQR